MKRPNDVVIAILMAIFLLCCNSIRMVFVSCSFLAKVVARFLFVVVVEFEIVISISHLMILFYLISTTRISNDTISKQIRILASVIIMYQ
jgi:hypothetical protein